MKNKHFLLLNIKRKMTKNQKKWQLLTPTIIKPPKKYLYGKLEEKSENKREYSKIHFMIKTKKKKIIHLKLKIKRITLRMHDDSK